MAVVAWHLSLCLNCGRRCASLACRVAPCGAPRLVLSDRSGCWGQLSRRCGAFPDPGGFRPRIDLVAAQGTRTPAENRAHCTYCWPPPRRGRWACSGSYPFGAPRGLFLAGTSGVGLGLCALGWFACVDPVTDASGFSYSPLFDGGLCRCTGDGSCGRRHLPLRFGGRHARVPCVCACACSSWPCRAGRPPGRVLVCLTFPVASSFFCFAQPPPGFGCPMLGLLFAFLLYFSSLSLHPLVPCFLWFLAPDALGPGAISPPPCFSFLFFLFSLWPAWFCVCFFPPPFSSFPPLSLFFLFAVFSAFPPRFVCFVGPPAAWLSVCSFGCSLAVAAPPPAPAVCFAVVFAGARCSMFFLCSFIGCSRRLLPPLHACVVPCAVCCRRAAPPSVLVLFPAVLPRPVLRVLLWCLALLCFGLLCGVLLLVVRYYTEFLRLKKYPTIRPPPESHCFSF